MADAHSTTPDPNDDLFGQPADLKTCSRCKTAKPVSEFYKRRWLSYCKECQKQYRKDRNAKLTRRAKQVTATVAEQLGLTEKTCTRCKETKPLDQFFLCRAATDGHTWQCKVCMKKTKLESQQRHQEKHRTGQRQRRLRWNFGMTPEQYEAMHEAQGGLCAICRRPETRTNDRKRRLTTRLSVDHDHAADKLGPTRVRGLLCHDCNRALGLFQDSPEILRAAAEYLESFKD